MSRQYTEAQLETLEAIFEQIQEIRATIAEMRAGTEQWAADVRRELDRLEASRSGS